VEHAGVRLHDPVRTRRRGMSTILAPGVVSHVDDGGGRDRAAPKRASILQF
jgi:hypothetical protein